MSLFKMYEESRLRSAFWVVCFFSGFACLTSLYLEYYKGIKPCTLCLGQRMLYAVIFALSILALASSFKKTCFYSILALFTALTLLSSYHLAVQSEIFPDPCKVPKIATIEDFRLMLDTTPSCSKLGVSIYGISLSWLNAVFSLYWIWYLVSFRRRLSAENLKIKRSIFRFS